MSAGDIEYLREKKVPELMEQLMAQLLASRPDSPYLFLRSVLAKPLVPGIMIGGPPGGGKGLQSEQIVARFGVVHISTGDLLRAEVRAGTELGKKAGELMTRGALVPDEIMIDLVCNRLAQPDCRERGWLLDGFPRTSAQARALTKAGIVPQAYVLLEVPDEVVTARISGRRSDPVTGKSYHVTNNPPPNDPEILKRLVTREDDTAAAMVKRLATYHKCLEGILGEFQAVLAHINGDRDIPSITKDVLAAVETRLLK